MPTATAPASQPFSLAQRRGPQCAQVCLVHLTFLSIVRSTWVCRIFSKVLVGQALQEDDQEGEKAGGKKQGGPRTCYGDQNHWKEWQNQCVPRLHLTVLLN